MASDLPDLLQLDEIGEHRYSVRHPGVSPEGRDVIFGGQILAQMMMASDREAGGSKDVKSIHAIFARAGTYTAPMELELESVQAGRTFATDTVTATQSGKILSRATVLLTSVEKDLIRHGLEMPGDIPGPDECKGVGEMAFPGGEIRLVPSETTMAPGNVAAMYFWHRWDGHLDSVVANQAILAWSTNGNLIGLNIRDHTDTVKIEDAHATISTGVIGHTIHFHDRFDVGQWLLLAHEGTFAGNGRVHGRGLVFTQDGRFVASFNQDSMVRGVEGPLDPKRSM